MGGTIISKGGCARIRSSLWLTAGSHLEHSPIKLPSYPLTMMHQAVQKLKLNTEPFVGVQLQDGQLCSLEVQNAGCRPERKGAHRCKTTPVPRV